MLPSFVKFIECKIEKYDESAIDISKEFDGKGLIVADKALICRGLRGF